MTEQLAPFSGQNLVGMSCEELCLLSELAYIDFTQFTVIVVGGVATEGPNLRSGLQSSRASILCSYAKLTHRPPPTTPITTTSDIITHSKKAAQNRAYSQCQKLIHPHNDSY